MINNESTEITPITKEQSLFYAGVVGCFFGLPLYMLSYHVQENVYDRYNWLRPVSDFLHEPSFLTSYFGILYAISAIAVLEAKSKNRRIIQSPLVLPLLVTLTATAHEIYQFYHPKYIDNNIADIAMTWLAFITFHQILNWFRNLEDPDVIAKLNQSE
jgi:hypothetical protein